MKSLSNYIQIEKVKSLSSQLDKCEAGAAVFYQLANNTKARELFKQRLENSRASIVLVKGEVSTDDRRVHCLEEVLFQDLFKQTLNDFYPLPVKKYMAVTGTNGKTSTVHLLSEILNQNEVPTLSIGTLGTKINGILIKDDGLTTPGPCELRRSLFELQDKFEVLVMEVSSHSLAQDRIYGISFDCAGWTNLTQDHLDYHKTMNEYFEAKLLIKNYLNKNAKLWISEQKLFNEVKLKFNRSHKAESCEENGLTTSLQSNFARKNLGLALAMAGEVGIRNVNFSKLTPPPGRFEVFEKNGVHVIIDYAHTPDALKNICEGIRSAYPQGVLTTVFGCGGDRDKLKRPLMAQAAFYYSDKIIITSDNPRSENPQKIIEDIIAGLNAGDSYQYEVDRKRAIEKALSSSVAGDVILVAGRGHEAYQEIAGERHPFSDASVVKTFWKI